MNATAISKQLMSKTRVHLDSGSDVIESMDEVTRMTLSVMIGISGLVGAWASACLVGAMLQLGNGPLQLAQTWFSTLTGL